MRLELYHPEWTRSCDDCAKHLYQEDGRLALKLGQPIPRPPGAPTPCHKCPKIPESAPIKARQFAVELSPQNRQAWEYYCQCRAVGRFPEDPIVARLAGLLRRLEDGHNRNVIAGRLDALIHTMTLIVGGASRG